VQLLRKIDPDVRAIVCSGYSNDPVIADHRRLGYRAAVAKPYDVIHLSRVLDEVIRGD